MKKALKILRYIFLFVCIVIISAGIVTYCLHTFSFHGKYIKYFALEPLYYYYEPLIDDYVTLLTADKYAAALSCVDPALLRYYANIYNLNKDILLTMDDALSSDFYSTVNTWDLHHTIEWDPNIYRDSFDKLEITADRGIDIYVSFETSSNEEKMFIYEIIQRNGFWYLLSVEEYTDE